MRIPIPKTPNRRARPQAINEEQQVLIEELSASKEELAAANHELMAFGEEMAASNAALSRLNRELTIAEARAAAARDQAEAILRTLRDTLLILDADLRIQSANQSFCKIFRLLKHEVEGRVISQLGNGQWDVPRFRRLLEDILPRNSFFDDFEITAEFDTIGRRTLLISGRRLVAGDQPAAILLSIHDITEVLQFQTASHHNG